MPGFRNEILLMEPTTFGCLTIFLYLVVPGKRGCCLLARRSVSSSIQNGPGSSSSMLGLAHFRTFEEIRVGGLTHHVQTQKVCGERPGTAEYTFAVEDSRTERGQHHRWLRECDVDDWENNRSRDWS